MLTMQSTNNDFWKWTKFEQIMINVYMQSCICIYISEESWLGSLRRQVLFTLILTAAAASQSVWCAREWFYWLGDHNWSILGERSKNILFGIIVKGVWHDIVYYGVFVQRFQTTISEVKSYKMVASCHVELREKKITLFHSLPLRYRKKKPLLDNSIHFGQRAVRKLAITLIHLSWPLLMNVPKKLFLELRKKPN